MAGSEAEERIRAKAEAFLRGAYPEARIIHELMLEQFGNRIDLAAVTPDKIVAVEIKSERDVFTRLPEQIRAAVKVSREVYVCTAAKHAPKITALTDMHLYNAPGCPPNPDYLRELTWCGILAEGETGDLGPYGQRHAYGVERNRILNPHDLLKMCWASELRAVCFDLGVGQKATRHGCMMQACEALSGREIRRRVCRELRRRSFPRADAPIEDPRQLTQGATA